MLRRERINEICEAAIKLNDYLLLAVISNEYRNECDVDILSEDDYRTKYVDHLMLAEGKSWPRARNRYFEDYFYRSMCLREYLKGVTENDKPE